MAMTAKSPLAFKQPTMSKIGASIKTPGCCQLLSQSGSRGRMLLQCILKTYQRFWQWQTNQMSKRVHQKILMPIPWVNHESLHNWPPIRLTIYPNVTCHLNTSINCNFLFRESQQWWGYRTQKYIGMSKNNPNTQWQLVWKMKSMWCETIFCTLMLLACCLMY